MVLGQTRKGKSSWTSQSSIEPPGFISVFGSCRRRPFTQPEGHFATTLTPLSLTRHRKLGTLFFPDSIVHEVPHPQQVSPSNLARRVCREIAPINRRDRVATGRTGECRLPINTRGCASLSVCTLVRATLVLAHSHPWRSNRNTLEIRYRREKQKEKLAGSWPKCDADGVSTLSSGCCLLTLSPPPACSAGDKNGTCRTRW